MKTLVLADAAAWHSARYVSELRRQGHVVYFVSMQTGDLVDCQLPPVKYGAPLSYISHVKRIKALIDEFQPDVVNAHFASAYGVTAARCRRRFGDCGAYWALTVWGSDILLSPAKSFLHRRRIQYALASADVIFADSTFLAEQTRELTDTPVRTILWGIERKHVADDNALEHKTHRLLATQDGAPLKLFAPRPHRKLYNNESLLAGLSSLLRSGRATLTVNSTGDCYERFMKRAETLKVSDAVSAYQSCSREEYLRLLQSHDIYLSAATSDSSPVSLIEALAVGVFPVCADHPGLHDLLFGERLRCSVYEPSVGCGPQDVISRIVELRQSERLALLHANREIALQKAIYEDNIGATARVCEQGITGVGNRPAEQA